MDAFGPHKRGPDPYDDPLGDGAKRQRMVVVEEASLSDDDDYVPHPVPIQAAYSPRPPYPPMQQQERPGRYGGEYVEDGWLETRAVGTGRGDYQAEEGRRYEPEWAANGGSRAWEGGREGYRDSRPGPRGGAEQDWRGAYGDKREGSGARPPHPMHDRPPHPMQERPPHPMQMQERPPHPLDAAPRHSLRHPDSPSRMRASPLPPRQPDYEPSARPSYPSRSPGYGYPPSRLSPPPPPSARSPSLQPGAPAGPSPHSGPAYAPSPRAAAAAPAQRGWGAEPPEAWGGIGRTRSRDAGDDRYGPQGASGASDMAVGPLRNPPAPRPHPDGYPSGYGAGSGLANPDSRQSDRASRMDRWEAPDERPPPAGVRAAVDTDPGHMRRASDPAALLPPSPTEAPSQGRGPASRAAGGSDSTERPATDQGVAPTGPKESGSTKQASQPGRQRPRRQAAAKEADPSSHHSSSASGSPQPPARRASAKPAAKKRGKARRKDPAQERAARAARRGQPSPDIPETSPTVGAAEEEESEDEGPSIEVQQQQLAYLRDTLLPALLASPAAEWFRSPVDPVALDIPHYRDVIKHPMDLGTVHARLQGGKYPNPDAAISDVLLVFNNCRTFNPPGHAILPLVSKLETLFNTKMKAMPMGPGRPPYRRQFCPHCGEIRSADSFIQHRTLFAKQDGDWDRAQKQPA